MLLLDCNGRYADVLERVLYNGMLSGVSLDGHMFFYVNPLASNGEPEHLSRGGCIRKEWHLVACCPPNVMRQLATFGHYIATRDAEHPPEFTAPGNIVFVPAGGTQDASAGLAEAYISGTQPGTQLAR